MKLNHATHLVTGCFIVGVAMLAMSSAAYALPSISSPAPGSTITGTTALITWTWSLGPAGSHRVVVGTTSGGMDIYDSGCIAGSGTSHTVGSLPNNGSTIYASVGGFQDGTCVTTFGGDTEMYISGSAASPPSMTFPTPGSTLAGSVESFVWNANGTPVTEWWLYIGNDFGSGGIHSSGSLGTNTATVVNNLPTDGRLLFVRLWYLEGTWKYVDFNYYASGSAATPSISSPSSGTTLSASSASFTWQTNGAIVCNWWLYAGHDQGTNFLFNSGVLSGATLSQLVTGLPTDGSAFWVRLWYGCGGIWSFIDAQYTAVNTTIPAITSPTAGSTLSGTSQNFQWTDNSWGSLMWWLYAGSTQGGTEYHNSGWLNNPATLSHTVTGLPLNGSTVWIRFWYKRSDTPWKFKDYQYTAWD